MLHSVRAYLLTLVAICIVLATCAFAFLASGAIEAGRKQAEAQTLETAKVLSQAVDRELEHSIGVLSALRESRAANRQEWPVVDQQARAAVKGNSDAWIVVQDRSGRQLVNTRLPKGASLPRGTAPQRMWQQLQSRKQRVCDLVEGQVERHVVCVDSAIGTSGQFAISMMFRPQFFDSIVRREGVSEGSIATLVDGNARIIWRSRGGLSYVGRQATGDMLAALQAPPRSGVLESTTLDGVRALSAFQQSPLSGWAVIVATPLQDLTGSASSTVLRGSALALLVLAIGCALAIYVASRLAKAMRALSQHGSGSPVARTGIREIDDAAAALERAAEADAHIRASEGKYRRIFEQTSDLLITADLNQVITDANPAAADAVGLSLPELIGRRIADFVSTEDFEKTSGMLRQKLEQGGTTRYDVRVKSSRGEWLFWEINSGLTHDEEGRPLGLHVVGHDVTERKRSERQTQVLLGELNHRVKNTLAVVQSLAHQTFRGNGELEKPKTCLRRASPGPCRRAHSADAPALGIRFHARTRREFDRPLLRAGPMLGGRHRLPAYAAGSREHLPGDPRTGDERGEIRRSFRPGRPCARQLETREGSFLVRVARKRRSVAGRRAEIARLRYAPHRADTRLRAGRNG
jgi:PAS domain S-box-containing protein